MFWKRRRSVMEFSQEIEAHLQLEADELEASGVSRHEAERRARAAFGSKAVARERFYLRDRAAALPNLLRDVRYGLRMMARNPAVTAVAVLTLTCDIGRLLPCPACGFRGAH